MLFPPATTTAHNSAAPPHLSIRTSEPELKINTIFTIEIEVQVYCERDEERSTATAVH